MRWAAVAAASLVGCTFGSGTGGGPGELEIAGTDSSSDGSGGGGGDTMTTAATGTSADTNGDSGPTPGTLTNPDSDGDSGDDTSAQTTDGAETTGGPVVDECDNPAPYNQIVLASNAVTAAPMTTWPMPGVPGNECAASQIEEEGTVAFPWHAPCDDEYHLWARVWDADAGANFDDPDSYHVKLDADGGEAFFRYGCQTLPNPLDPPPPSWHWVRLRESITCVFDSEVITYSTTKGPHTFVFRNREAGTFDTKQPPGPVAAIARILVTNDPNYVPNASD